MSCSFLLERKTTERPCEIKERKFDYLSLPKIQESLNPATNKQTRGGHLCFNLVTARHNETLGEKIESAHDCKTDKNS